MTQNPTETQYTLLGVGDVRQPGDEVRHIDGGAKGDPYYGQARRITIPREHCVPGPWVPVRMLGATILPADLIAAEFRREVK